MRLKTFAAIIFSLTTGAFGTMEALQLAQPGRFIFSENAQRMPHLSLDAMNAALWECSEALARPQLRLLPGGIAKTYEGACDARAREILAGSRENGLAMYVLALTAAFRGDAQGHQDWISASIKAAPFEGWLAERRFTSMVADNLYDPATVLPDIRVLLTTQRGAELLTRYLQYRNELRPTVAVALRAATDADQRRMHNLARKAGLFDG